MSFGIVGNSGIEEVLLEKENLDILESVLCSHELESFSGYDLSRFKRKPKVMPTLSRVMEILPEVKSRADGFLQVNNIGMPKARFYNWLEKRLDNPGRVLGYAVKLLGPLYGWRGYSSTSRYIWSKGGLILLRELPEPDIIEDLAHEYAHHVQFSIIEGLIEMEDCKCFIEGHARGVERKLAKEYTIEMQDQAFWSKVKERTTRELSDVYRWLCKKHSQTEKWSRTYRQVGPEMDGSLESWDAKPNCHALGNAAFYLAERRHGDGIYAAALRDELDFLNI